MKKTIAIFAAMFLAACSDADTARRVLANEGMTEIVTTGYDFWGCGKDDQFSTGFTATNSSGKRVKGVVCSGWKKGATIRYY